MKITILTEKEAVPYGYSRWSTLPSKEAVRQFIKNAKDESQSKHTLG